MKKCNFSLREQEGRAGQARKDEGKRRGFWKRRSGLSFPCLEKERRGRRGCKLYVNIKTVILKIKEKQGKIIVILIFTQEVK